MIMNSKTSRAVWRGLALAGIVAGAMSAGSMSAFAGSCPADKIVPAGQGQKPDATMPKDVTDTVIGSIDLSKEPAAINDRTLRLRKLVIQAGGREERLIGEIRRRAECRVEFRMPHQPANVVTDKRRL